MLYIVVYSLVSSKTVVKDLSFASICLGLPAKSGHPCSANPLPWQIKSIRIMSFLHHSTPYNAVICGLSLQVHFSGQNGNSRQIAANHSLH